MKACLITTGVIFALVTVVHVWRAIEEGPRVLKNPMVLISTVIALALGVWALRLLRKGNSSPVR